MRDVINKNVTEEQLLDTAHRVFSRGWGRMKLYFMIGLPTETDDDVIGIIDTSLRTRAVGRRLLRGRADITTSVSSHVPKPHTPFQWSAMDTAEQLQKKQALLLSRARAARLELRLHSVPESVLECVFARGDRALADVIEHAWRAGARFDSWQDRVRLDLWRAAFEACHVDPNRYTGTFPIEARLPWDHIHVGLAEGFLAKEYRKALGSRLSPPCGKQHGRFVHYSNAEDAIADQRPLVCYDCGADCDLDQMRQQRIDWLGRMRPRRLPLAPSAPTAPEPPQAEAALAAPTAPEPPQAEAALAAPTAPEPPQAEAALAAPTAPEPPQAEPPQAEPPQAEPSQAEPSGAGGGDPAAAATLGRNKPQQRVLHRYRFRFEKLGASVLLGHLDLVRAVPRLGRRAGLKLAYTLGFHPKPYLSFSPALSLGTLSLAEYVDVQLLEPVDPAEAARALTASAPSGLTFTGCAALDAADVPITRLLEAAEYWVALETDGGSAGDRRAWWEDQIQSFLSRATHEVSRTSKGATKAIDVRSYLESVACAPASIEEQVRGLGIPQPACVLQVHLTLRASGGVKVSEIVEAIGGSPDISYRAVRAALCARRGGQALDPLDLAALRATA